MEVVYSDNTSLPLHFIDSEDYFLEVSAVNPNIVGVTVAVTPAYQPHVVANGKFYLIISPFCSVSTLLYDLYRLITKELWRRLENIIV